MSGLALASGGWFLVGGVSSKHNKIKMKGRGEAQGIINKEIHPDSGNESQ